MPYSVEAASLVSSCHAQQQGWKPAAFSRSLHRAGPARAGKRVHMSLLANPSHLEAVDPIVLGKVRAKQHYSADTDRAKNLGVLLHGDGAFSGQVRVSPVPG